MKKNLLLVIGILICFQFAIAQENYSRVKIYGTDYELSQAMNLGITLDHGEHKKDMWFMTDLSETEIQILADNGFNYEIIIEDVSAYYVANSLSLVHQHKDGERSACPNSISGGGFSAQTPANWQLGSMAGFYTYQEFLDELDSMASKYPDLISTREPISTFLTHDGNPIYWLRISDNPSSDEAEPEVLYTSLHHSREPASLSQLIFYMWWLLENYGTDEEVTYLVNETEMYFVPMINPDGYIYNQTTNPGGGGMHRKNRRNVGTSNKGVDLNRNYSYEWGTTGVSFSPNNDTYCGTGAFSEPETQAIKWFCENHDFEFAHNAHTHGNLLLFPYGFDNDIAPDHDYFQAYTNHMVEVNGYAAIKSSGLYPASGDSDDWMYADDLVTKPKIYATTPECSSEGTANDFWPPQSTIHDICQENVWMNKTLAHMPHIYGVSKETDPSKIETTTGYFHYEITRLGLQDGDITVSMTPLAGILTLGSNNVHTLTLMETEIDSISYTLNSGISFGDEIKYVLHTDNGMWIKHDTITKTFGTGTAVFTDDCNDLTNWTGTWDYTPEDFVSPSNCITDSPFSEYDNDMESEIQLNQSFSFQSATYAYITFNAKWAIENDWDYVQFMASTDNGTTWIPLCGKYTNPGGTNQDLDNPLYDNFQTEWVLEEIDLSDFLGESDVRFKFYLYADGGVREDGFYFDDFSVFTDHFDDSGVDEFSLASVEIYPNPAQNNLTLQIDHPEKITSVTIYNELGEAVSNVVVTGTTTNINLESYAEGVYYLQTIDANNSAVMNRFVVVR